MKSLIVCLIACAFAATASADLKIVTTAPDYADIAKQIGRDKVDVHSVMKGPENVHNVMAKPTEIVYLNNADFYKNNAIQFVNDMADLSREIKRTFEPYAGLKVVTFHKAWEYFADAVPMQIVGTIEPHPAITPSPQQVKQTIDLMKREGVKV